MRTPLAVIGVLLVALAALAAVTGAGQKPDARPATTGPPVAPIAVIARRVEALRDLRYRHVPRPQRVTPAQARREGLEELDRTYPVRRRRADEEVLKLLGLIEPDVDLRAVTASVYGEGVAGYYDPRSGRLKTVSGAATGTRVLAEIVLAHELTHALEDQRFHVRLGRLSGSDDEALAYLSLVEGTASALMFRYAARHFTAEETLGGLLATAFQDTGEQPPFLQAQLVFPYVGGREFVEDLLRRGGGSWALVDAAHRVRPPASTEQVIHPRAYLRVDEPAAVRIRARSVLGEGWSRAAAGTFGELQTRELLAAAGGGGSSEAAAGWGGDRYELWRRGDPQGCAAPCRRADALVMRWRWDTPRDEAQFAVKLRALADSLGGVVVATARSAGAVTLALAPTAAQAKRLARAPSP